MPSPGGPSSVPGALPRREFLVAAAAGLAGALGACTNSTTTTEPAPIAGPARITSRPHLPYAQATIGFSSLGLRNEFTHRDGVLYVPSGYRSSAPAPLLILLHGSGGSGADWSSAEVAGLADSVGAVVLAPDSRSLGTWDIVESGNYDTDLPFLDIALNHTFDQCRIDPTRVAIGGFSDGASTALSLGFANGDFTRSVMAFSPGFMDDRFPRGNPRFFVSHGSEDPVLSFTATRDVIVPFLQNRNLPLEWAPFPGGHQVPDAIAAQAIGWLGAGWR